MQAAESTNAAPSSSSAMWAKKAKATCAACATSFSSPMVGDHRFAGGARRRGHRHHHCRRPGQPPLRSHRPRPRRPFLERLRRGQSHRRAGAGHRSLYPHPGADLAQDDFQRRHHQWRHLGQLHSPVGHHARGHALGFGGGTRPPGARAARGGRGVHSRGDGPQEAGATDRARCGSSATVRRPTCRGSRNC